MDDILIHTETAEEHVEAVARVLDMFLSCGLRAHPQKSVFGAAVVEFLGHNVSNFGLAPTNAKVRAITNMRVPTNVSELRSAVGLFSYYRCYVPNFAVMCAPLYALLKNKVVWVWGVEQQTAFENLKQALIKEGNALKHIEPDRELVLHTDWCVHGAGAILGQTDDDGNEYMCACASRSLSAGERNYSSYQGEMLAVVWAVKTFRIYLHGAKFRIITDHQPLQWLMRSRNLTGQYARWALCLQEYDFTIEHRPGVKHQNADGLSRLPQLTTFDGTGWNTNGITCCRDM